MNTKSPDQISIRFVKPGRYTAQFTVDGKRRNIYGSTEEEVRMKLSEAIADRRPEGGRMIRPPAPKETVQLQEYLEFWLSEYILPTVRPSTYTAYEVVVRVHVNPAIGWIALHQLEGSILQTFFNSLRDNLSPKSITNIRNMLHYAFSQAALLGLLQRDPMLGVRIPRNPRKEMRVLSREEQNRLITTAYSSEDPMAYSVVFDLFTGLRRGELLGLQWRDIDFDEKFLSIRRALEEQSLPGERKTQLVLTNPKTDYSLRRFSLCDSLVEDLRHLKEERLILLERQRRTLRKTDFVFTGRQFQMIPPRTFSGFFQRLCKSAGIQDVTFHTLRHSFATRSLEVGIDIVTLSRLMGHSTPATTLAQYCHALPDHTKQQVQRLEDLYIPRP